MKVGSFVHKGIGHLSYLLGVLLPWTELLFCMSIFFFLSLISYKKNVFTNVFPCLEYVAC